MLWSKPNQIKIGSYTSSDDISPRKKASNDQHLKNLMIWGNKIKCEELGNFR